MGPPTASENLQRVGILAVIPSLLRSLGISSEDVLTAAGLDGHALDDPDSAIPYEAMGRLLQIAADRTGRRHLGLDIGKQLKLAALGHVGELMRYAPTLRAALNDFTRNQHRNAHGSVIYLIEGEEEAVWGYAVYQPNVPGSGQICDIVAVGGFNLMREMLGMQVTSLRPLLSQSLPDDLKVYQSVFGLKPTFDSVHNGVAFPKRFLDQPVLGADALKRADAAERVEALWVAGDLDIATRLRRRLRVGILTGSVSASIIAGELGMSQRTLQRRLIEGGTSFRQILDETRYEFVQQLLSNTRLDVGEIASIVGYADPSVLTRGFGRWAGMTPSEWRNRH
jgi:AraC-like DNA-binding protein